ncbi:hypothetical protein [Egbenema bharatensis]|uniref:hypothetical protein n=1 Tax=Egbenema bharatensis TaxID=3463334 RepID=UPI003A88BFBE
MSQLFPGILDWAAKCSALAIEADHDSSTSTPGLTTDTAMRLFNQILGLLLILAGIYFLGQNIFFTTQFSRFWWRGIPAMGSVLMLTGGLLTLLFAGRSGRDFGWILIGLGILFVFLSGGVVLRPTSLVTFLFSFASLFGGYKLMTARRFDF